MRRLIGGQKEAGWRRRGSEHFQGSLSCHPCRLPGQVYVNTLSVRTRSPGRPRLWPRRGRTWGCRGRRRLAGRVTLDHGKSAKGARQPRPTGGLRGYDGNKEPMSTPRLGSERRSTAPYVSVRPLP